MPNSYKSLSDCKLFKAGDEVEVWYMNQGFFADGIMGNSGPVNVNDLTKTHILLGTIGATLRARTDMIDDLFGLLQGERWSPKGEARELILDKGLLHTSMSVGDIIRFKDGDTYFCANKGWEKLNG